MKERLRKKEKEYLSLNCFDGREKERRKCKISQLQKLWRRGKWMILFMSRAARETSGLGLSPLETDRYGPPAFSSETNAWIIHRLLPRALLVWFFSFRRQKGFCNLNPNCEERERERDGDRIGAKSKTTELQSEGNVERISVSKSLSRPRYRPPLPLVHRHQH